MSVRNQGRARGGSNSIMVSARCSPRTCSTACLDDSNIAHVLSPTIESSRVAWNAEMQRPAKGSNCLDLAGRRVLGKQEAPTAGGKHLFNDPTLSTREVPYKGQKIQQPGVWIRTNQQWEEALPRTSSDLP